MERRAKKRRNNAFRKRRYDAFLISKRRKTFLLRSIMSFSRCYAFQKGVIYTFLGFFSLRNLILILDINIRKKFNKIKKNNQDFSKFISIRFIWFCYLFEMWDYTVFRENIKCGAVIQNSSSKLSRSTALSDKQSLYLYV